MRWNEQEPYAPPPQTLAALARRALESAPGNPALEARLGGALAALKQYGEAAEHLARGAAAAPEAFTAWDQLVICHIENGEPWEALAACDRAAALGHEQALDYPRGLALVALGREAEGFALLRRAVHEGAEPRALNPLLRGLARGAADAGALLAECEALPDAIGPSATAVAFRAIALSLLGRTTEAGTLIDLDRHVLRLPFTAHEPFGGLEAFNRGLDEEISAAWQAVPGWSDGSEFSYHLRFDRSPRLAALKAFMQQSAEHWLAVCGLWGLDRPLGPPPTAAHFVGSATLLRGLGRNGQHVHAPSCISMVYHLRVPDAVRMANDSRGALMLGCCDEVVAGHVPCWGRRTIKPVEGWLTVFPAHIFHDVVPTSSEALRISLIGDVYPTADMVDQAVGATV